ncbi:MAG: VOC family protein [Bacteroidetes bacterium B1(2017)]|nr:MAG: VOC family protein [Bacteroidetes bacterium B1(2017)]
MAKVAIYLNFQGKTEEAFNFYKSIFNTEFSADIFRMGGMGSPELPEEDKNKVMHVALPTLNGVEIRGTDNLESMGHFTKIGNNTTIYLEPDTREETERIFGLLAEGGSDLAPLAEQMWGALWGCCLDKYGIRWMLNFPLKK